MAEHHTWDVEDRWWRDNFASRPYATGRNYEEFQPAYRYGYESGQHHMGRTWNDVEADLQTGWDRYEGRGGASSTWENIKEAVRDAWHRVTGQDDLDAAKMRQDEASRFSERGPR